MKRERKELTEQEAYEKAAAYCVRREHCLRDVERKLYEWGVAKESWARIIDKLTERGFVDEPRFARAFSRDKHLYAHWGQVRIRQELRARGISNDDIEAALQELFDDHEEADQLRHVLETKMRSLKPSDPLSKRRDQLIRFALYRGYPYESIRRMIAEIGFGRTED